MNEYKEVRRRWMEGESQRSIAKILGISRNTVKKYCAGDIVPWERKAYLRSPSVLTPEVKAFVKQCLKNDEDEHTKKQNHTARRIYTRLVEEMGFTGGETTVRAYVHALKGKAAEAFVPLYFAPGDAIQIDWGEATVSLAGDKLVVNLFCARLCYSDMPFVIAYRRQNSESFLDVLVQAFEFFGGTPKRVIFDNAKVAVKDGFGANAQATDGYAALSAHYGFEPIFCNIASGNEKGLVEGLVGFSRRNFCVPIATWQKNNGDSRHRSPLLRRSNRQRGEAPCGWIREGVHGPRGTADQFCGAVGLLQILHCKPRGLGIRGYVQR